MGQSVNVTITREEETETDSGSTVDTETIGGPYAGEVVWTRGQFTREAGSGGVETVQRRVLFLHDMAAVVADGDIAADAAAGFSARIQRVRRYYDNGAVTSIQCDIEEGRT